MNPTTTTTAGTTGPTQTTGSGDPERAEFNACQWLIDRHLRDGRGDRVAVRCEGESHTYSDIHAEVRRAASGLRALGVRPEERVAMVMLDSVEFVATFLGGLRVGAVPVLVNPLLPPRDLAATVADSRARVRVISQERAAGLEELLAGAPEVQAVVTTAAPDPASDPPTIAWADFTGHDDDSALHPTWAESPGFWLCTSGTTGRPKLAMHRHG
ncbi:MAG: AMP-binding protein, partial [Acidimicrobiales bacterium]